MAIVVDQLLGGTVIDAASTTVTFNTGATVASSGFIVVTAGLNTPTTCAISGGGLTWTTDTDNTGTNAVWVASAQAPSGLASGTTLTATFGTSGNARFIAGVSFTGVKTSTPVDTFTAKNSNAASTGWSTPSATLTAGSVFVASAIGVTTNGTSAPTSPAVEIIDVNGGAGTENATAAYHINAAGGADTVAGTWSTTQDWTCVGAAYLAAAGGGGTFTDSGSGSVTLSGSSSESWLFSNATQKLRVIRSTLGW